MSEPYCKAPWHALSLAPNGQIGPCCMIPYGLGDITKGDTLEGAWNGESMRKFRQDMLAGTPISGCNECKRREAMGIKPVKDFFNEMVEPAPREPYSLTSKPEDFLHLDISLSNKCNLKCRFCHPGNSTAWFRDRDHLLNLDEDGAYARVLGHDQVVVDVTPEQLLPFMRGLTNLRQIELKGGEPFMSQGHLPLLRALVESGQASKLALLYTSNGTMIDPQVYELWKEFREISFAISVDGVRDLYRYVRGERYGFEEDVLPSLHELQARQMKNVELAFHFTICSYNILGIADFLETFEASRLKANISFGLVETPNFLSIRILPESLVQEGRRRLERFRHIETVASLIEGLGKTQYDPDPKLRRRLRHFTESLDARRKQRVQHAAPEIATFIQTI